MDKDLLLYYMRKADIGTAELAKRLNLSTKTVYNKLNGVTEFTASEIREVAKACSIGGQGIIEIFFTDYVN